MVGLTQQSRFITTGNAENLFRQRCTETKLGLTWELCEISSPENLALNLKMFLGKWSLCQEAATWLYNMQSIPWYDQDVPQQHVETVKVMSSLLMVSMATAMWFPFTVDSEQPAVQQMIRFSHDNIYWTRFGWKNASGYVGDQTHLHVTGFTVSVGRLKCKRWNGSQ